jgi:hypothetical protein
MDSPDGNVCTIHLVHLVTPSCLMDDLFVFTGLFIIDGIITVPIGLLGFLIMPGTLNTFLLSPYADSHSSMFVNCIQSDLPYNTRPSLFYTESQLQLARRRMEEVGRKPPAKYTKEKVIGFFKTWHLWCLVPRKYSFCLSALLHCLANCEALCAFQCMFVCVYP